MTEKEETMMEEKRMAQLDPRLERVADFVRPVHCLPMLAATTDICRWS